METIDLTKLVAYDYDSRRYIHNSWPDYSLETEIPNHYRLTRAESEGEWTRIFGIAALSMLETTSSCKIENGSLIGFIQTNQISSLTFGNRIMMYPVIYGQTYQQPIPLFIQDATKEEIYNEQASILGIRMIKPDIQKEDKKKAKAEPDDNELMSLFDFMPDEEYDQIYDYDNF